MIKIAGTLPVKSRLPLSAWLLAALVTLVRIVVDQCRNDAQPGYFYCVAGKPADAGSSCERPWCPCTSCRGSDMAWLDMPLRFCASPGLLDFPLIARTAWQERQ
jgi:hypothetical protein